MKISGLGARSPNGGLHGFTAPWSAPVRGGLLGTCCLPGGSCQWRRIEAAVQARTRTEIAPVRGGQGWTGPLGPRSRRSDCMMRNVVVVVVKMLHGTVSGPPHLPPAKRER